MEIKGITIDLYTKTQVNVDDIGNPIFSETVEKIENVLVAPVSEQEVLETINLIGRKAIYQLAIPKGDTHDWINVKVGFFGQVFRTIGMPISGIEAMLPLAWNTKVKVEIYDGQV